MTGRHNETQTPIKAWLLASRDLLDFRAGRRNPLSEIVELARVRHFEADIIHSRHVGRAQDYAVPVEFIPGTQIYAPVRLPADLMQSETVDIVGQRRLNVDYPDLDITGSQYSGERHLILPEPFTRPMGKNNPCEATGYCARCRSIPALRLERPLRKYRLHRRRQRTRRCLGAVEPA